MKNLVITGAAGNLGNAVTAEFLKGDYHLNVSVLEEIETTEKQKAWYPDLTNMEAVKEMIDEIEQSQGAIDTIIHLVGGYQPGSLDETEPADIEKMIHLNFNTAFNLVKAALPYFKKSGGKFIFIGAKAAMKPETAGFNVAYALSKQLLVPLVQLINEANKEHHVAAHIILPGTLDTALNRKFMPDADFSTWVKTSQLAETMRAIVDGEESRTEIYF